MGKSLLSTRRFLCSRGKEDDTRSTSAPHRPEDRPWPLSPDRCTSTFQLGSGAFNKVNCLLLERRILEEIEHQASLLSSITSYGASCTIVLQAQACRYNTGRNLVDVEVRDLMTGKPLNPGQKLLIKPAISFLFRQTNKTELKEMHICSKLVSPDLVLSGNQDCCQAASPKQ